MYALILALHSLLRWLVVISLSYAVFRAWRGWYGNRPFTRHDNRVRHTTATIAHIQLALGICLYYISPIIQYFLHHYKDAVHDRGTRFFGMEHSSMMLMAVILVTVGSAQAKRQVSDNRHFRTMAIWYTIALLIILAMIPWPFSPLAMRPYFRALPAGF